jgi:hypothetical protein
VDVNLRYADCLSVYECTGDDSHPVLEPMVGKVSLISVTLDETGAIPIEPSSDHYLLKKVANNTRLGQSGYRGKALPL